MTEQILEALRFNWGHKTPAEIVEEFVLIRGDLSTPEGREALARVIQFRIDEARRHD